MRRSRSTCSEIELEMSLGDLTWRTRGIAGDLHLTSASPRKLLLELWAMLLSRVFPGSIKH